MSNFAGCRYVAFLSSCCLLGGCDPYWVIGSSDIVEEIPSQDCVIAALSSLDGLSKVAIVSNQHRTLTGKTVIEPNTYHFDTEFGTANLWYTEMAKGNWKWTVGYTGIGLSEPPTMGDGAKLLMEEVAAHLKKQCFANDV